MWRVARREIRGSTTCDSVRLLSLPVCPSPDLPARSPTAARPSAAPPAPVVPARTPPSNRRGPRHGARRSSSRRRLLTPAQKARVLKSKAWCDQTVYNEKKQAQWTSSSARRECARRKGRERASRARRTLRTAPDTPPPAPLATCSGDDAQFGYQGAEASPSNDAFVSSVAPRGAPVPRFSQPRLNQPPPCREACR